MDDQECLGRDAQARYRQRPKEGVTMGEWFDRAVLVGAATRSTPGQGGKRHLLPSGSLVATHLNGAALKECRRA